MKRKPSGHPARQDPTTAEAFRLMKGLVELVRTSEGRVSGDAHLNLKAAALGAMNVYAELAGLPKPDQILERNTP